ncbi:MAG: MarR family winged helix-turn-helix transcriptional regulator [Chloroflexota bacterium]
MAYLSPEEERQQLTVCVTSLEGWLYSEVATGGFDQWLNIDVTMPQFKTLILVYGSDEGWLRMGQLAAALRVALSTATGIVDRLVEQGLLLRQEDPEDRRSVVVRLSERGYETVRRPHRVSQERLLEMLAAVPLESLRQLAAGLTALRHAAPLVAPLAPAGGQ